MTTQVLLMQLAADFLDALALEEPLFTSRRLHPSVDHARRGDALGFWLMHGVSGMVLRTYRRESLRDALGDDGVAMLEQAALASQLESLRLLAALQRVLAVADQAGISVAPFKGPTEAAQLYGDFGVRATSDLDVLVSPRQRDRLLTRLQVEGWHLVGVYPRLGRLARRWYRHTNHALVLRSPSGISLDLHWRVNEYPMLNLNESRWLEDYCRPMRIAGQPAWQLMPVARYLALLSHAARSEWFLLKWWTDLVRARRLAVISVGEAELLRQLQTADALLLEQSWLQSWQAFRAGILPHPDEPGYWLLSVVRPDPQQYFAHMWRLRQNIHYRLVLCWRELVRWDDLAQFPLPDALFPLYFFMRLPLMVWRRLMPRLRSAVARSFW